MRFLKVRDKHLSGTTQGIAAPALGHRESIRGLPGSPVSMEYSRFLNGGKKCDGFKIYFKVFEQVLDEVWICYFSLECK